MQRLAELATELGSSILHRPYTFIPFALFALIATLHLGLIRFLLMSACGYLIAFASELCSIHTGFPYGLYAYVHSALERDLLVLGVPFFDSLSYTFLAYFAWVLASLLHAPQYSQAANGERLALGTAADVFARRSPLSLMLGGFLMTWCDVVVDPVATMGDRWFLGKIHVYATPGSYFGVPLSNFVGWLLVSTAIVGAYQLIDRFCDRWPALLQRSFRGQALIAPAAYFGIAVFAISISLSIGERGLAIASSLAQLPIAVWLAARFGRSLAA
jgi:putative membrane protein